MQKYAEYPNWWPISAKLLKKNIIQVQPIPQVKIQLEAVKPFVKHPFQFNYIKGPFRGQGTWDLRRLDESVTQVTYTIQLQATNMLFQKMSQTKLFAWKHTADIKRIISHMEKNIKKT